MHILASEMLAFNLSDFTSFKPAENQFDVEKNVRLLGCYHTSRCLAIIVMFKLVWKELNQNL